MKSVNVAGPCLEFLLIILIRFQVWPVPRCGRSLGLNCKIFSATPRNCKIFSEVSAVLRNDKPTVRPVLVVENGGCLIAKPMPIFDRLGFRHVFLAIPGARAKQTLSWQPRQKSRPLAVVNSNQGWIPVALVHNIVTRLALVAGACTLGRTRRRAVHTMLSFPRRGGRRQSRGTRSGGCCLAAADSGSSHRQISQSDGHCIDLFASTVASFARHLPSELGELALNMATEHAKTQTTTTLHCMC